MTMNVGEIGKLIVVNMNYDMAGNTSLQVIFTRPDRSTFTRSSPIVKLGTVPLATKIGMFAANQYVSCPMQAGDLTAPGEYLVRVRYEDATPLVLIAGGTSFTVSE